MPKTNLPHRSNNYGLYGVLVLLLTGGYHYYFGTEEELKETKTIVNAPKSQIRQTASLKLNKIDQSSAIRVEQAAPVKAEINSASAEDDEAEFIDENVRQSCWDYIRSSLGGDQAAETAVINFEEKLLKNYPSWYLGTFTEDKVKRTTTVTSTAFSKALAHLDFNIGRGGSDPIRSDSEGIRILTNLYTDEPENSAYLVFLAMAYDRLGNNQQAAKILSKLKDTEYFYTYRGDTMRDVYKNVNSVEDLMAAFIYDYRVSRAYFNKVYEFSKKYDLSRVAIQIMEKNSPEAKGYNAFDWDEEEYLNAEKILEEKNPELLKKYVSSKEYKEKIYEKFPFNPKRYDKLLAKKCEVKTLESQVKLVKEFVKKHPDRIRMISIRGVAGRGQK